MERGQLARNERQRVQKFLNNLDCLRNLCRQAACAPYKKVRSFCGRNFTSNFKNSFGFSL
jgi:uncharacterized protein VirK/YbjX